MRTTLVFVTILGISLALPTDPLIKMHDEFRYIPVMDAKGKVHMADTYMTPNDFADIARYNPNDDNKFFLYTRRNPAVAFQIVPFNNNILSISNFDASKRTFILVHGWMDDESANMFTQLLPAILSVEDANVIVLDWNHGGGAWNYFTAAANAVTCGEHLGEVINWLIRTTESSSSHFTIFGHSLGGHIAGVAGRNTDGQLLYINALDPALPGFLNNDNKLNADDALYTEVIHTNGGVTGYLSTLGDVDFYPNGGLTQPGCGVNVHCSHVRSYEYLVESIVSGGFSGKRCATYLMATTGLCYGWNTLYMGGINPKIGATGVYYLETNSVSPYAKS